MSEIESGKLQGEITCPHCNRIIDGYTDIGQCNAKPKIGDVSICAYCKHILVFEKPPVGSVCTLILRYMIPDEYLEYEGLSELIPCAELNGRLVSRVGVIND